MSGLVTRIGLLGGTFDPPHIGHIRIAQEARSALGLDEVLLGVANQPWQKVGSRSITSAEHRLAMVCAATEGIEGVHASSIEIDRGGDSYTIDTLEELSARNDGAELFLIVGADAAAGLETWRRFVDLAQYADLVVVNRSGTSRDIDTSTWPDRWRDGTGVRHLEIEPLQVSSSALRRGVSTGLVPPGFMSDSVLAYVREHHLYDGDSHE